MFGRILLMLRIRLQRVGRKNEPQFRFVLTDRRNAAKSGKFLEVLGFFDFRKDGKHNIDGERVKELIAKGAIPTDTVHNYLVQNKIIEGKKRNVLPKKTVQKKEVVEEKEAPKKVEEKTEEKVDITEAVAEEVSK